MRLLIMIIALAGFYFTLPMLYAVVASAPLFPGVIFAAPLALFAFCALRVVMLSRR